MLATVRAMEERALLLKELARMAREEGEDEDKAHGLEAIAKSSQRRAQDVRAIATSEGHTIGVDC
jgi:hypothetical protein